MTRWWRAHASALDDPKVQRLPGDLFKSWFNVLCIASLRDGILPPLPDIAFALRKSEEAASKTIEQLKDAGLIDVTGTGLTPHNWNGRQYKSDVSTDRVQQFRKRRGNVSVTPSEDRDRTDYRTEQNNPPQPSAALPPKATEELKNGRARTGTRLPDDWRPTPDQRAFAQDLGLDPDTTADIFADYWHAAPGARGRKADWGGTWRNWCRKDTGGARNGGQTRALFAPRGNDAAYEQLAAIAHRSGAEDDDRP